MKKNVKSVPEIRFPGFTDLWEERKLGNTVQITMGQSPNGGTYSDVPSDYILVQGNADLRNGWVFPRVWTSQMTKQADAGDLIMSVRAPAGAMGKTAYNVVIGRGVAAIKGNEFMYQLLVKMDSDGYWKTLSCGSTFESLNSNNIKNADVFIPDIAEQEKIGKYFYNLDNLITFQETQCKVLKDFKQCMLQKMFPKDGSDKPEIRFPGFTDSWEQRKVGELLIERNEQAPMNEEYPLMAFIANEGVAPKGERYDRSSLDWEQRKFGEMASSFEYGLNAAAKEYDGENKYIRITDIDDNTHEFLSDSLTSPDIDLTDAEKYKLSTGDILFARTGASVGKSYIYRDYDGLVYYAGFLIRARIKDEYDAEFVFQNTLTDKYNKYIAVTSQRSGQPGVNAQEYSEFKIQVPKKEEQIKIGKYFQNLDNLITLHAVTSQRSGQPGVNAQEYSEFKIQVPKKEEQIKIGKYFQNLDNLITLQERKCKVLRKLKKCMLQKMFV